MPERSGTDSDQEKTPIADLSNTLNRKNSHDKTTTSAFKFLDEDASRAKQSQSQSEVVGKSPEPTSNQVNYNIQGSQPLNNEIENGSPSADLGQTQTMTRDDERMDEIIENYNSEGNPMSAGVSPQETERLDNMQRGGIEAEPDKPKGNGSGEVAMQRLESVDPIEDPEQSSASRSFEPGDSEERGASREAVSNDPIVVSISQEVPDDENQEQTEVAEEKTGASDGAAKLAENDKSLGIMNSTQIAAPKDNSGSLDNSDNGNSERVMHSNMIGLPKDESKSNDASEHQNSIRVMDSRMIGAPKDDGSRSIDAASQNANSARVMDSTLVAGPKDYSRSLDASDNSRNSEKVVHSNLVGPRDDENSTGVSENPNSMKVMDSTMIGAPKEDSRSMEAPSDNANSARVMDSRMVIAPKDGSGSLDDSGHGESSSKAEPQRGLEHENAQENGETKAVNGEAMATADNTINIVSTPANETMDRTADESAQGPASKSRLTGLDESGVKVGSEGSVEYHETVPESKQNQGAAIKEHPDSERKDSEKSTGKNVPFVGVPSHESNADAPNHSEGNSEMEEENKDTTTEDEQKLSQDVIASPNELPPIAETSREPLNSSVTENTERLSDSRIHKSGSQFETEAGTAGSDQKKENEAERSGLEPPATGSLKGDRSDADADARTTGSRETMGSLKKHKSKGARNSVTVNPPLQIVDNTVVEKEEVSESQANKDSVVPHEEGKTFDTEDPKQVKPNTECLKDAEGKEQKEESKPQAKSLHDAEADAANLSALAGNKTAPPVVADESKGDVGADTDVDEINKNISGDNMEGDVKAPTTACCILL